MLDVLVGAINNDTTTISKTTGIRFPKHLTDEVCRYLVVRDGYFDFKGRSGLIKILLRYVPEDHYLIKIIKKEDCKYVLDKIIALRNLAAHNSAIAKSKAKSVLNQKRLSGAGPWLKSRRNCKSRLEEIINELEKLAKEIEKEAPY